MPSDFSWGSSDEERVNRNLARFHRKNPSAQYEYVRQSSWQTDYIRKPSVASNFSFPPSPAPSSATSRSNSPKPSIPRLLISPPNADVQQIVKRLTQHGPICVFIRHCQGEQYVDHRGERRQVPY
jgi:hypothetical protein